MINQPMYLDSAVINDQRTLEDTLTERFGHSEKELLMDVYRVMPLLSESEMGGSFIIIAALQCILNQKF